MKPVNLNQILSHPKSDCLSFFQTPFNNISDPEELDAFIDSIQEQLRLEKKRELLGVLEKHRTQIKKILKTQPDKTYGFYLAHDFQGYVILDQKIESYSIIGQTFHVRPLVEELFVNPEFLLINVSLYDIKIYRGDFLHLEIIQQYEFDKLPKNFHGQTSRVYAPQYLGLIPYKTILAIKTIAQKVKDLILYQSLPVIVTGLEEMKTIFLRYFDVSVGVISHLHEDFYEKTCVEIIARCKSFRSIVMDYYSAQLKERLKRMTKSTRIISDLGEIIRATYAGRVVHLVIPIEQKLWGKLNPETGEFTIHKKLTRTSIDILNELVEEVIKQGGKIQVLAPHFFPNESRILAILEGT